MVEAQIRIQSIKANSITSTTTITVCEASGLCDRGETATVTKVVLGITKGERILPIFPTCKYFDRIWTVIRSIDGLSSIWAVIDKSIEVCLIQETPVCFHLAEVSVRPGGEHCQSTNQEPRQFHSNGLNFDVSGKVG